MSNSDEKHNSELSMDELDNVAGGGATAADSTAVAMPTPQPVAPATPPPQGVSHTTSSGGPGSTGASPGFLLSVAR